MSELTTPKMSHEEMIDTLKGLVFGTFDRTTAKEREALDLAISVLESDNSVLEDIRAEIQTLRNCSCNCSDGIIDDVEDILDKYISGKE